MAAICGSKSLSERWEMAAVSATEQPPPTRRVAAYYWY